MSDPFVGEVRAFGFDFAPRGWAFCNGSVLPIMQNQALFSVIGTYYGGDGRTTFGLPDLRGRAPVHAGTPSSGGNFTLGQSAGEENHTLISTEIPAHTHTVSANNTASDNGSPAGAYFGGAVNAVYKPYNQTNAVVLAGQSVAPAGGSSPHSNMPPYQVINYCIATQGIFPPRS